jgi:DNA polymerase III delta subunit
VGAETVLALITGDDAWAADDAVGKLAAELARDGAPVEVWRVPGTDLDPAVLTERLATEPLFGGGTLVVVDEPGPLLRASSVRETLLAAMDGIAPGNGLAMIALDDGSGRRPKTIDDLGAAVRTRGGRALSFRTPTQGNMQRFIGERARALGIDIEPKAAQRLGERIGASVREGDVDRRRQAQSAVAELEKLALYRPGERIVESDVDALVPETIPGTTWGFLDAVAARRTADAAAFLARLFADGAPLPLLTVQLHRRIRSLIEAREHLVAGGQPSSLPRILGMKEFPARKLAEHARAWSLDELDDALQGLFELDVTTKGLEGVAASETEAQLALELWLYERVRPAAS